MRYVCYSHRGKCRGSNQDNFICQDSFMTEDGPPPEFPVTGCITPDRPGVLGVFDGLGGEERGETAALLAAQCAAQMTLGADPVEDLLALCARANASICAFAGEHGVRAMGTTAALLAFTPGEIALCNIGDSKVFRFAHRRLEQLSVDHYAAVPARAKPPLSQSLGIPPSELVIAPYVARGSYHHGDLYLLCSDGLTDMVEPGCIAAVLSGRPLERAAKTLLAVALNQGGRDNITIILCRVEREAGSPLLRWLRARREQRERERHE